MRLASFTHLGRPSFGAVSGDGIVDLSGRIGTTGDLRTLIASDEDWIRLAERHATSSPDYGVSDVEMLPVIPTPSKILCVGLNYETHRRETGRPPANHPTIFARYANTLVGHGQAIWRPRNTDILDFEGELAVVIGRPGRHIDPADAHRHIAGYACFNDATLRDWQQHSHQYTPGKNFPSTAPFGPWMTTTDEVANIEDQTLSTTLNGRTMQQDQISSMIFPISELIAYCSAFTRLEPGDVIATGTPGGVGFKRDPQVLMEPGDEISVAISGVGTLTNSIIEEPSRLTEERPA